MSLRHQPDPEAPTRDEIREACEAVVWEWVERRKPPGEEIRMDDFDHARQGTAIRFHPTARPGQLTADALALLEAWRLKDAQDRWYQIDSPCLGGESFGVDLVDGGESSEVWGATLPAAAVRAVNAWSKR